MSLKRECACGHDLDTHYKDPVDGKRYACTGLHCDCARYDEGRETKTTLLPPNNFDESLTAAGGGRPHISCGCSRCVEWQYDQMRKALGW
jgi:hypothetical protein